jgi:hypothetical protein
MGRKRKKDDGLPKIPTCHACHMRLHHDDQALVLLAIERAPGYWKRRGLWDQARPYFETFLARRQYLEDTKR